MRNHLWRGYASPASKISDFTFWDVLREAVDVTGAKERRRADSGRQDIITVITSRSLQVHLKSF